MDESANVLINQHWMQQQRKSACDAFDILSEATRTFGIPGWAKAKLLSANEYVQAACMVDFLLRAETALAPTSGVRMKDGTVKTQRAFLVDEILTPLLARSVAEHGTRGQRYADAVKGKVAAILSNREFSAQGDYVCAE